MRAKVFQLECVKESDYKTFGYDVLDEDAITDKGQFPDPGMVEWWINSNDRKEDFDILVSILPDGMFDANYDEMSLTYVKRPDDFIQAYFDKIKEAASELTLDNLYSYNVSMINIKALVEKNYNECMTYCCDDSYPIYFNNWILGVACNGVIGDKFYLGGVIDYHA